MDKNFRTVNFIKLNGSVYRKVAQIMYNELIRELDILNIPYQFNSTAQKDMINIWTHAEEKWAREKGFCPNKGVNIMIHHGVANKGYVTACSCQHVLQNCDYVISFGNRWNKIFESMKIPKDRIKMCGSLKIDYLYNLQKEIKEEENTICYAPTHNNCRNMLSSFPEFLKHINKIDDKYKVLVSPHPFNSDGHIATTEAMCRSKVVICDSSSTIYEALALGKTVIFTDFITKNAVLKVFHHTQEAEIYQKQLGYHFECDSENHINKIIKNAFENGISKNMKDFIDNIIAPDCIGYVGRNIALLIKDIMDNGVKS